MNNVTAVPAAYFRSVRPELQGTIQEVSYPVGNYIHPTRHFVTNQNIDGGEAGRQTVAGDAIWKKCSIYVPAAYDPSDLTVKYNVLYLLHGVGGDHEEWLRNGNPAEDGTSVLANLFDNLIANGDTDPLIVVFPNGRSAHDWKDTSFNTEGTHLLGFYYFDYELRYDLVPFIESNYKTYANLSDTSREGMSYNRMHRAIAGLSMGGMQALNLIIGGHRQDSIRFTGTKSPWNNGLDRTVRAPGMLDIFAYVGAFSNAPTSSDSQTLAESLVASEHNLDVLYVSCGDADLIAIDSYIQSIADLSQQAGEHLHHCYHTLIPDGLHDFRVWNHGIYHFSRLIFK